MITLPKLTHKMGYSEKEVKEILFDQFLTWMKGQTVGIDEHEVSRYYPQDVDIYVNGGPITD